MTTPTCNFRLSAYHLDLLDAMLPPVRVKYPDRSWDRSALLRHMIEFNAQALGVSLPVATRCPTCECAVDVGVSHVCAGCPRCHKPLGPAPHHCFA